MARGGKRKGAGRKPELSFAEQLRRVALGKAYLGEQEAARLARAGARVDDLPLARRLAASRDALAAQNGGGRPPAEAVEREAAKIRAKHAADPRAKQRRVLIRPGRAYDKVLTAAFLEQHKLSPAQLRDCIARAAAFDAAWGLEAERAAVAAMALASWIVTGPNINPDDLAALAAEPGPPGV